LYLIHVADMPHVVGLADDKNSGYANDTAMWAIGKTVDEVVSKLNVLGGKIANYAKGNGLALNAAKAQIMFSTLAGCVEKVTVVVDGTRINQDNTLDLLGVKFDRKFSTAPHMAKVGGH
jgi:hypothetical protein